MAPCYRFPQRPGVLPPLHSPTQTASDTFEAVEGMRRVRFSPRQFTGRRPPTTRTGLGNRTDQMAAAGCLGLAGVSRTQSALVGGGRERRRGPRLQNYEPIPVVQGAALVRRSVGAACPRLCSAAVPVALT